MQAGAQGVPTTGLSAGLRHAASALLAAIALLCAVPLAAQGVNPDVPAEARAAHENLFRAMLADPANLEKTFAYAQSAIAVGDFEGAISALERMLFVNPDLPRVRLELGVLYYRLGSYVAAKQYFDSVLEQPNVPEPVRARVDTFMAEIAKRDTRHHLSGSLFTGLRYQTNANTSTPAGNVLVGGISAQLDERFTAKKDWNVFAALSVRHSYDLDPAAPDTWDTALTTYVARQADQKRVNVTVAELTSGPALQPWPSHPWAPVLRPYALVTVVGIDDMVDFWAPGAGTSLTLSPSPQWQMEGVVEFRDRRFTDTPAAPNKTDRDGPEATLRARLSYAPLPQLNFSLIPSFVRQNTHNASDSNHERALTATATLGYPSPVPGLSAPWLATASATRAYSRYDAIDPTISADQVRTDRDWRLSLTQVVPLSEDWAVLATLARTIRTSSLPNFAYQNDAVTIGMNLRF